jgi:putative restriction endonuclease
VPVRVIRGRNPGSIYAPPGGFRYDGLYYVEEYWQARGGPASPSGGSG